MEGKRWSVVSSWSLSCVVAVCLTLVVPASSLGASKKEAPLRNPVASFAVPASNGYVVGVGGGRGRVSLLAIHRSLEGSVSYEVPARVTGEVVRARFGKLGRIAVRFQPSGRVKHRRPPRGCQGRPKRTIPGVFVGAIRFRGEQGYTRLAIGRAKGKMEESPRWRCRSADRGDASRAAKASAAEGTTVLEATSSRNRLAFSAGLVRPSGKREVAVFNATSNERRGKMLIERSALAIGRDRTLAFDEGLTSATVSPPRPFSGSAAFLTNPDGTTSWTGDLRVDFPGAKNRSLVGDTFTARLSRQPAGRDG